MLRQIVLRDPAAAQWLFFRSPVEVLMAERPTDVPEIIAEAERRVQEHELYAAGFVTYEASPAFDNAFVTKAGAVLPPACFGLFATPRSTQRLEDAIPPAAHEPWRMSVERDDYRRAIAAIREQIALGNTYQVNFTVRQRASGIRDPWALFANIAADAPYAAFIECEDHAIVSASPELFFHLDGDRLTCKPMKGTAARGLTLEADNRQREALRESEKNRAENVMIADMLRNDMGRVAVPGTVVPGAMFDIEKYPTVWQMTSTLTASTRASVGAIFAALFPCASVTGAPKVASMRLIAALEKSPREIYTGAIGFMAPARKARFSVAIRTAWIDRRTRQGTYGVGGGIVWDSDADGEYAECLDKAKVLSAGARRRGFRLLESLLWTPGEGWFLRDEHLGRMRDSAAYFDFPFDLEAAKREIDRFARELPARPCKVRVQLHREGRLTLSHDELADAPSGSMLRLAMAREPVDKSDPFLYHKTTERSAFDQARQGVGECDDVLLWNREREITESTIANVVVRLGGRLLTPPVECGLLPGTFRAKLLREGSIAEAKVSLEQLDQVEEIFLVNSVRGWMPCRLVPDPRAPERPLTGGRSRAGG
ncbi:MAG TPA: aminodeoxychorismate synthase component I [Woeseiaceae bacterium]|nr:aminodeoxychorismate synthase component I [Woeseiaceae bacterium]